MSTCHWMLVGDVQTGMCCIQWQDDEFVDMMPRMSDPIKAVGNEKRLLKLPTKVAVLRFVCIVLYKVTWKRTRRTRRATMPTLIGNINYVPPNAELVGGQARLYIFEDSEPDINRRNKGRSPTMRHISRVQKVNLD